MIAPIKKLFADHWLGFLVFIYVLLAVAGALEINLRDEPKGKSMDWSEVRDSIEIKAKPDGIWTVAYEYVQGPALIKIEANDDQWEYAPGKKSTANGDLSSLLCPQQAILPSAPVGAMIGKVGGSTAGTSDGRLFVVGKTSVLPLDQNTSGPLFLTVNDELTGLQNNSGSIKVKISIRRIAQAPAAGGSAIPVPLVTQPVPAGPVPNAQGPGAPVAPITAR